MNINSVTNSYAVQNYANQTARTASASKTKSPEKNSDKASVNECSGQNAQYSLSEKEATTFPIASPIQRLVKYTKVIDEHYAKVNSENKRFANPSQHINDKYFNTKSPYYIKGLSQREREICADSERRVLNGGSAAVNSYDPVIQKTFGGGIMDNSEWNEEVRSGINDSINQLFAENGIVIPEDADLRLRVDPYEYKIHASGVDDALAKQIEDVLNRGKNGAYLYEHIYWCDPAKNGFEQPSQYLYDTANQEKAVMWHLVNDLTGYDIRKLENKDGTIYTPDGQDLWDVMTKAYQKKLETGEMAGVSLQSFYKDYQIFAKEGWDKEDEKGLSIGYKNGSLYDIDTKYGYGSGQNEWLQKMKEKDNQFWSNYQRNKEKETGHSGTDVNTPNALNFETEQENSSGIANILLEKQKQKEALLSEPTSDYINMINYLFKEGNITRLTDEILSLPGNKGMNRFDVRA